MTTGRFVQEARDARTDGDTDEPNAEQARANMIKRQGAASQTPPKRIDRARTSSSPDHPPVEQADPKQHKYVGSAAGTVPRATAASLDAKKRAMADAPKRVPARRS